MRVLVTGGAGFIGSNLVGHLLEETSDIEVVNLDLLTYAGNLENLEAVASHPRYRFVHGDICDEELVEGLLEGADAVINLAAESHVDRSIISAKSFVQTNVMGTQVLLAASLRAKVSRFVQVSTDEVYGELPWRDPDEPAPDVSRFTEDTPLAPRSPYSASKAGADLLALSYHSTHALDVVVTRCSNNYGPYQFPEKLIPLMITNAIQGDHLPVYGDGLNVRDWIHVRDHCRGILAALREGVPGRVYNFGGASERKNISVVRGILDALDLPYDRIRFVNDRQGHDRRYAVEIARARSELRWEPTVRFDDGLARTVRWYRENDEWWRRIRSGDYRKRAAAVTSR